MGDFWRFTGESFEEEKAAEKGPADKHYNENIGGRHNQIACHRRAAAALAMEYIMFNTQSVKPRILLFHQVYRPISIYFLLSRLVALFMHRSAKNLREDSMYFSGKIEYYKVTPSPRPPLKEILKKN